MNRGFKYLLFTINNNSSDFLLDLLKDPLIGTNSSTDSPISKVLNLII